MRDDIIVEQENGELTIDISKAIAPAFYPMWFTNCNTRYRVLVGARNTGKSKFMGYECIMKIISDPLRNIMVLRQNDVDNRDSTFENIVSCIHDLGFDKYFKVTTQPLKIVYEPTGQKILFRGCNNPTSITSLEGMTDLWIEEGYQIDSFETFRIVDASIRSPKIKPQITITLNAWSDAHWIFKEFCKDRLEGDLNILEEKGYQFFYDPDLVIMYGVGLAIHQSSYKVNPWRAPYYDTAMLEMKTKAPAIYAVEAAGMWGQGRSSTYPEFGEQCLCSIEEIMSKQFISFAIGIDTGYSDGAGHKVRVKKDEDPALKIRSATVMELVAISNNLDGCKCYCIDEYFHSNDTSVNVTNTDNRENMNFPSLISTMISTIKKWIGKYQGHVRGSSLMSGRIDIYTDMADIPSRDALEAEAFRQGLYNLSFNSFPKTSIRSRVDFDRQLMAYGDLKVCKEQCPNLIREYKSARMDDNGDPRVAGNDHALDSQSYAFSPQRGLMMRYKDFKER